MTDKEIVLACEGNLTWSSISKMTGISYQMVRYYIVNNGGEANIKYVGSGNPIKNKNKLLV